jgi:hypothetical protein
MPLLLAAFASVFSFSAGSADAAPAEGEQGLLAAAREVTQAAAEGRAEDIVARVSDEGFGCLDLAVTRAMFRDEMAKRGSWMQSFFFDREAFQRKLGSDRSVVALSEVLAEGKPLTYRVLQGGKAKPDWLHGCVLVGTGGSREVRLCFSRRRSDRGWSLNLSEGPWCG